MDNWTSSAPWDFRTLAGDIPAGRQISQLVLEPRLVLRKIEGKFVAHLFGVRVVRGNPKHIPASSLRHNWVSDDHVIRPLPHDTPDVLKVVFSGRDPDDLTFADVIALLRDADALITIEADDNVLSTAQDGAEDLSGIIEVPGLKADLYPYQAKGVRWMLDTIRHTGGLILADEMGLGKTIQIISLLLSDRPDEKSPALIICPTSLIANWRSEILRFGPELSILIHRGNSRAGVASGLQRAQVVITTYDTLVNDQTIFRGVKWSWLICDEAQAVKNPETGRRIAVGSIPRTRTIPMTGTPVETSLLDLWSLADLAIPGLLGSREDFEATFTINNVLPLNWDNETVEPLISFTSKS